MIIDTHVHIGGENLGFDMKKEYVLKSMEKYNIDFSIVSDGSAAEVDHSQRLLPKEVSLSQTECLINILDFAKSNPTKIGAGIWIKPLTEKCDDSFSRLLKNNLDYIYCIKCHPFHSGIPFDDERIEPYINLAAELNLPVLVHTADDRCSDVKGVFNAARKHPTVKFIMAHMGLGTDNKEATELIGKLPNLYGDTAWVPISSTVDFIKNNGSEKLLFGSDNPIDGADTYYCNKSGQRSLYQEYFSDLKKLISKDDYENIMYKNAVELFGIKI
ncbi:MAG: amidohydrolase family protein [Acutalibacteraceae bacterium]